MIDKFNHTIFNLDQNIINKAFTHMNLHTQTLDNMIKNWPSDEEIDLDEAEEERLKNYNDCNEPKILDSMDVETQIKISQFSSPITTEDDMSCEDLDGLSTPTSTSYFFLRDRSRSVSPLRCEFVNNYPKVKFNLNIFKDSVDLHVVDTLYNSLKNINNHYNSHYCNKCQQNFASNQNNRESFIKHVREVHLREYIYCQMKRILSKEITLPTDIELGEHLGLIMEYIGDGNVLPPAKCYVPGCLRKGKDRNIMSGHFRSGHKKTYKFCQILFKKYETKDINREISLLDAEVSDAQSTRRKYLYKGSSPTGVNEFSPLVISSDENLSVDSNITNFLFTTQDLENII